MPGGSFAGPYSGNDSESIEWALVGKDLTISCWVKIPNDVTWSSLGSLGVFGTMADLGNHNSAKSGLSIGASNTGYPNWHACFNVNIAPSNVSAKVTVNTTYKGGYQFPITWSDDDWHLITVTYKFGATDADDYQIYFDNAQTLGATSGTPPDAILTSGWTTIPGRRSGIGGSLTTSGGTTAFQQREFVVWDRLLTSAERTAIYSSGVPLGDPSNYPSGAVAGWMFENNIEIDRTFYNSQQQYTGRVTLKNAFDNSKYAFVSNYDIFNRIPSSYNSVQTNHISIPQVTNNPGLSSGMDSTNLVPSNLIKSIPYSGYSMDFDLADDDSVNCGTDTSLNILSDLSISIWFKTTSSGLHTLINRDQGSGNRIWNISISEQAGQPYIAATFRGDVNKTVSDQVNVNDGNWHNVIAVYDPSTFIKLYVDGVLEGTDSTGIPSSLTDASSVPLYIGAYSNFGSENFDGQLSNASIFNRILTEDEVIRIYNGGSPGNLSSLNPTSWWSLGADSYFNGSDWICPDIGANTNNGTSANMGAANLVGDGPDSLANGTSTNLDLASDLIGEAPGSTGNAISINMNSLARTGSTP